MYNIPQILDIAREKKKMPILKRPHGRSRKRFIKKVNLENKDKVTETLSITLNLDLKQSVSRRTRSRR